MQQGGSQFGVSPEMPPFAGGGGLAEAASPISSRPPAAGPSPAGRGNFDELGPVMGSYQDDDTLAGEEAERGVSGNRWPRQETLALLKIRSEMDAVFRDATLKGPLWEDVSRKLAELGYIRSAKKCKEKFENVHKYYKRTKEGRAGRQDGKSYRFFSQLEALHSSSNTITTTPIAAAPPPPVPVLPVAAAAPNNPPPAPVSVGIGSSNTMVGSSARIQHPPPPVSATPTTASAQTNVPQVGSDLATGPTGGVSGPAVAAAAVSFSSNSSSSDSDSEDDIEERPTMVTRKRKRSGSGGSGSWKKMAFFEGLMKEVMEKQEAMQQRFLEAIEKREQDRMVREEAWKRQEMARLAREHEIMMQERAMAASRDAAVIAFLQKMTGQAIQITQPVLIPAIPPPQPAPAPPPQPQQLHYHHQPPQPKQPQQQQQQHQPPQQSQNTKIIQHQPSSSEVVVAQPEQQEMGVIFDTTSSSRWPKSEVLALIKLRSGLETRYQEAGPKGPLWEEISAGMHRLGFNRSAKRCKEKWENINKYFKKVKESNKKRPEDAKTCPYFHQLDALYRKKLLSGVSQTKQEQEQNQNQNLQERGEILAIMPPPPLQPQPEAETKNNNNNNKSSGDADPGGSLQVQTSNGGLPPSFFQEGPMKKPEDIVKELMEHQQQQQQSVMDDYNKLEEPDSDNLDQEDDDEEEDEEDRKMPYKIQYQRPNSGTSNGGGNTAATSFLAMVQKLSSS